MTILCDSVQTEAGGWGGLSGPPTHGRIHSRSSPTCLLSGQLASRCCCCMTQVRRTSSLALSQQCPSRTLATVSVSWNLRSSPPSPPWSPSGSATPNSTRIDTRLIERSRYPAPLRALFHFPLKCKFISNQEQIPILWALKSIQFGGPV